MCREEFFKKLNEFQKVPMYYTDHALRRAIQRNIDLNEIFNQIVIRKEIKNIEKDNDKFKLTLQEIKGPRFICVVRFNDSYLEIITVFRENIQLQKK